MFKKWVFLLIDDLFVSIVFVGNFNEFVLDILFFEK